MTATSGNTELIARIGSILEGHSFGLRSGEHHEEVATRIVDEVLRRPTAKAIPVASAPLADVARQEQVIRRNYAASAVLACIALADEVVCFKGSAQDVASSLRARFTSTAIAAEPKDKS